MSETRRLLVGAWNTPLTVKPNQLGSGDPSLDNYRDILPGYRVRAIVGGSAETLDVYGGTIDYPNGTLTITHKLLIMDGVTTGKKFTAKGSGNRNNYYFALSDAYTFGSAASYWVTVAALVESGFVVNCLPLCYLDTYFGDYPACCAYIGGAHVFQPRIAFGPSSSVTTIDLANVQLRTWFNDGTPFAFVYKLKTPETYQLA